MDQALYSMKAIMKATPRSMKKITMTTMTTKLRVATDTEQAGVPTTKTKIITDLWKSMRRLRLWLKLRLRPRLITMPLLLNLTINSKQISMQPLQNTRVIIFRSKKITSTLSLQHRMQHGPKLLPIELLQSWELSTMQKHSLQNNQLSREMLWLTEPKKLNGTYLPFLNTTGNSRLQPFLKLQLKP